MDWVLLGTEALGLVPRWPRSVWQDLLRWLHVATDVLIWASLVVMPIVLVYSSRRRKVPIPRTAWLLIGLILMCSLNHLLEVAILQHPVYRLSGLVKILTAGASLSAVVALARAGSDADGGFAVRDRTFEARVQDAHLMAGLGAWSYDPAADAVSASDGFYRLIGQQPGSALGGLSDHLQATYVAADAERLYVSVERALSTGEPFALEVERRAEDGLAGFFLARGFPRRDDEQRIIGLEGTALDITQLKQQERQLAQSNQRLEEAVDGATSELRRTVEELEAANHDLENFVHMASHDMQEPLRALRTYAQLLREDVGEAALSEDAAADLRFIQEASARMHRMLDALVELSHTGQAELYWEPVDVRDLALGILDDFSETIEAVGAHVTEDDLPVVTADAALLERVYSNLVSNAIKFGGAPPTVHLSAEQDGEAWILGVMDNGPGVEDHLVQRAFLPFKRIGTRRGVPGTGMGLAICKRAIERLGGRMWIERGSHGGAHVRFTLPPAPKV